MRQRWFLIFILSFAFILQVDAQISTQSKGKKVDAKQKDQVQIDDQLAGQYFREQEFDKARDIYASLYQKTGQIHYFQQYTECLIQLKDFDQAEKELKTFSKKNPNHSKSIADLIYVYTLQGKNDKAEKRLNEVLKGLPANAPSIRGLSNAFQARGLYNMAIAILDKGNKLLEGEENFYLDLAYLNQSMLNYQEAFRYYFLELEAHPGQYNNIRNRLQANALPTSGFERDLMSWEHNHKFAFDPIQRQAIQMALAYRISIITGGPGTGKTTILKGILHLAQKMDESVFLAAPTGRAAKRMGDLCGIPARTIHRMLEMDPVTKKFTYNAENQIHCDLLIVDEFSMVDTLLAAALLAATPFRTRIVLVGDADQLPSVGPGNVLNDLVRCPRIPTTRLQHIFRQAGGNDIADKAAKINAGILPSPIDGPNFHFVPYETPEEARAILQNLLERGVREKMNIDQKAELQILTPMRKGPLGVFELNALLQNLMNPGKTRHRLYGTPWSDGDKVMQIKNNYDKNVFNGDVGIIFKVAKDAEKVTVFYDDKTVEYEGDEVEQLTLAYASTIHKSQGSEYPAVIVILDSSHYMMLQRNLIYTAITRAKGHVWVLSAPGALATAVRNSRRIRRFTRLAERLL